jgi:hypothetical protein
VALEQAPEAPAQADATAPWWREPTPEPAPLPEVDEAEPPFVTIPAPKPVFGPAPPAEPARSDRLRAFAGSLRAWWPHQWRPIVAAAAVVGLVVVTAGFFGYGPLGHKRPAAVKAPVVAAVAPAPAPAPAPTQAASAPAPAAAAPKPAGAPDDPAARAQFYQDRAKAGDADSQLQLAILYAKGEGVKQDYTQAATWFRAAAAQGVARAQYDIGVLSERGRGVPVNYNDAFLWYSKSSENNFPLAQYNLAVAYTRGQGTRQDFVAAAGWYRRAALQGVVPAMVNLAILYERGEGVTASAIDAYAWYRAAAERGNQPAAQRGAELFDVLSAADRGRAEAQTATVLAQLPAPEPGPTLKSGLEPDNVVPASTPAAGKPAAPAH